jgi:hypothetical protein
MLFKTFLEEKGIDITHFPLSTIAHISEGCSAGGFKMAIDNVVTERRKL